VRRPALAALLAVAACALLAAPAAAAPARLPRDLDAVVRQKLASASAERPKDAAASFFDATVSPAAPRGYEVEVFGLGNSVGIAVGKKTKGGLLATTYTVRGTVTRGRIEGRFGKLGSISMRFHPVRSVTDHCLYGIGIATRGGYYTGGLRFQGEGGYISLHTHRARGKVTQLELGCHGHGGHGGHSGARASSTNTYYEPETSYLLGGWKHGVSSLEFLAIDDGKKGASFLVKTETSRGRIAIERLAVVGGHRGVVDSDRALTSGRVQGPAPLHGAATYTATPDGAKFWKGKLSINLLGEPHLPLTGPKFEEVEFGRGSALQLLFLLLESLL
jgi:hypothetical protein